MKHQAITKKRALIRARVRQKIHGSAERPRLNVHVSGMHIRAQIIDDTTHKSLVSVDTVGQKTLEKQSMTQKAQWVGEQIAAKAKTAKVQAIVFDRGWRGYHGRVKVLAEAARKGGLTF